MAPIQAVGTAWRRAAAPSSRKQPAKEVLASDPDTSRVLSFRGFLGMSIRGSLEEIHISSAL